MKIVMALMLLTSSSFAQTQGSPDIVIQGGNISIVVRGSGGFVCSAQDGFKKQPRLGRGMSRAEAEANARYLAAMTAGGNDFFVKTMSCEPSATGAGGITIVSDAGGLHVNVEGPSQVQCISTNSMASNGAFPYIANAATQTEAYALSSNACTVGSNDDGFFCKTNCQRIATAPVVPGVQGGQINIPGVKMPKIKFPKISF